MLKIYCWSDVLVAYTSGAVYIVAESIEQARQIAFDNYATIGCPEDFDMLWNEDWFTIRGNEPVEIPIEAGYVIEVGGCD